MGEGVKTSPGGRFLFTAAAFVVVVAGMRASGAILIPFLLSVFLAVISAPPLFWLQRKGVPKALAMLLVIAGVIGIGLAVAALIGTSVDDFSRDLPAYQERLQGKAAGVLSQLRGMGIEVPDKVLLEHFDPGAAMQLVATMLSGLSGALTNAFLILLTVIFILMEASSFPAKLLSISDNSGSSVRQFNKITENIKQYMAIKTWVSLLTGISISIWLAILGVDFPLLWGLLAFLLNYVPNLGSIIAAVPAVLLALIQLGTGSALLVGLGFLVVNIVVGSIIEPRFMGRGLGLSTLVVFLSLVFWGWALGPVGMLLSVPLTMTLKIALESSEETRWIAVLLGPEAPPETPVEISINDQED